jgi:hypothetical protein
VADSVVVPVPSCVTAPVPLITPASVIASLRLIANVALFVTFPAMLPVVPPAPTCSVPAVIVVPPV